LQERANFHEKWIAATSATRIALQDKVCTLQTLICSFPYKLGS
jgi:hypothetical protein